MTTPMKQSKRNPSPKPGGPGVFEQAFIERMGLSPVEYIMQKLQTGSDLSAIEYLYGMISAEIARQNRCINPGFTMYYEEAQRVLRTSSQADKAVSIESDQARIISQLIGGKSFINHYDPQLKALSQNQDFISQIKILRKQTQALSDSRTKAKAISDFFYHKDLNRFLEVMEIVDAVRKYGKQASAHISIFYAMYLYE